MKKRVILLLAAALAAVSVAAEPGQAKRAEQPGRQRFLHNNDGTDLLSNIWFGRRPLSKADLEACVDLVAGTGVTTYMMCSGSDFAYYRSKYARVFGDDRKGELPNMGDTLFANYYRNFCNIENEGGDFIGVALDRARAKGMETFITYRMNDCHFADTRRPRTIYTTDFWMAHPECWMGETRRGWHADGALDFAHGAVREQKLNMISEQLEMYGDRIDGFEMDFLRFPLFFKEGKGEENAGLMTELVRSVRAKVDSVAKEKGRPILLAVRVPDVWQSCLDNGLDVRSWVEEGLVDFITVGVYWRGDPAVDVEAFRKESGIGSRIPVYASVDDGSFNPRESYTHGMMRGAASYALSHGADGIYLFNFFLSEYNTGKFAVEQGGKSCRVRTPELLSELGSLKSLEGRNKSYSYYCGFNEYGLSYKTPMPLKVAEDSPAEIVFDVADNLRKHRPEHVYVVFQVNSQDSFTVLCNGKPAKECPAEVAVTYGRGLNLRRGETLRCFEIPRKHLRRGRNALALVPVAPATVSRLELVLDFGDPALNGYN